MRKVLALGATILFVGSVGVAGAQERLQQSGGSAMGVYYVLRDVPKREQARIGRHADCLRIETRRSPAFQ